MATSFAHQIPAVIYVLQQLAPRTVLDVGKGFGKYGFLIHEYVGISTGQRPDPARTLAEQSAVVIDAVDIQPDYAFPHLPHIYRQVIQGDIGAIYSRLAGYDVVLMADIIEHLPEAAAVQIIKHFVADGSVVIITTPKAFFKQELYESEFERHVSHWPPERFVFVPYVDWQPVGPGRVYLLASEPKPIRGFGHRPLTRARRIAAFLRDEFSAT